MNWKVAILGFGIFLGAVAMNAIGQRGVSGRPWLEPATPTQLEWLVVERQADEGINDWAKSGMTINYSLAADSAKTGVIECNIVYARDVPAAVLQLTEDGIEQRFSALRKIYPWARVKIKATVAPF